MELTRKYKRVALRTSRKAERRVAYSTLKETIKTFDRKLKDVHDEFRKVREAAERAWIAVG